MRDIDVLRACPQDADHLQSGTAVDEGAADREELGDHDVRPAGSLQDLARRPVGVGAVPLDEVVDLLQLGEAGQAPVEGLDLDPARAEGREAIGNVPVGDEQLPDPDQPHGDCSADRSFAPSHLRAWLITATGSASLSFHISTLKMPR